MALLDKCIFMFVGTSFLRTFYTNINPILLGLWLREPAVERYNGACKTDQVLQIVAQQLSIYVSLFAILKREPV